MNSPLVSIVIPTFNRRVYLRQALWSALRQTFADLEIVVVDNASVDGTEEEIRSFTDPRIRYFRHPTNIGQFGNFKAAFAQAKGRYVVALGDDDLLKPNFVECLVRPLEADPDLVLSFCDHDIIDGDGRLLGEETEKTTRRWQRHKLRTGAHRPFGRIALVDRSICTTSAALVRRDAIDWKQLPSDIELGFDLYVAYAAARTGKGCWYDSQRLTQYRYHTASASNSIVRPDIRLRNCRDAMNYWDRFARDPAVARDASYFRMKRGYNALLVVLTLIRAGDRSKAREEFFSFLRRGWIVPTIFLWHAVYAARLNRMTA